MYNVYLCIHVCMYVRTYVHVHTCMYVQLVDKDLLDSMELYLMPSLMSTLLSRDMARLCTGLIIITQSTVCTCTYLYSSSQ